MPEFFDFFNNSVLFWSLLSCLLAQFFKIVFNFFSTGNIKFGIMFETGGMPSSHSALITGATSGIGFQLGFDSPIFALAIAVSLIVMYDASGVRKSAGIQAAEINKLSRKLDPKSETNLKETLGHTKFVAASVQLGKCKCIQLACNFLSDQPSFLNLVSHDLISHGEDNSL